MLSGEFGRVEDWRGVPKVEPSLLLPRFRWECLNSRTVNPFAAPAISTSASTMFPVLFLGTMSKIGQIPSEFSGVDLRELSDACMDVRPLPGMRRKVQAIGFLEARLRKAARGRRDLTS
jgi:hypothetical protein